MARPDIAEEGCTRIDSKIANAIEEEDKFTGEICKVDEYKIILLEQITLFKSFLYLVLPSTLSPAPQQLVSSSAPSDPSANLITVP